MWSQPRFPICGCHLAILSSASVHLASIFWQEVMSCYEEWEWPSTLGRSGYKGRRRPGMVGCRTPILTSAMLIREDGAWCLWSMGVVVSFDIMVHVHQISDYPDFFLLAFGLPMNLWSIGFFFVSCQRWPTLLLCIILCLCLVVFADGWAVLALLGAWVDSRQFSARVIIFLDISLSGSVVK